jgi:hypothetical protein
MPIDSTRLDGAKAATLAAAGAAKEANVISEDLFARLTDGAISVQDWAAALNVRQQNYTGMIDAYVDGPADGSSPGELAQKLFVAVNDQREAQGMASTIFKTVSDLVKGTPSK